MTEEKRIIYRRCPNCGNNEAEYERLEETFDDHIKHLKCTKCGHKWLIGHIKIPPSPPFRGALFNITDGVVGAGEKGDTA